MAAARASSKTLPLVLAALALCVVFAAFGRCQLMPPQNLPEKLKPPSKPSQWDGDAEMGERWSQLYGADEDRVYAGVKQRYDASKPPLKPLNAYMLWLRDNRPAIKASLPEEDRTKYLLVAEERWVEVDDSVKREYAGRSEAAKAEYGKKLAAYQASLGRSETQDARPDVEGPPPESHEPPGRRRAVVAVGSPQGRRDAAPAGPDAAGERPSVVSRVSAEEYNLMSEAAKTEYKKRLVADYLEGSPPSVGGEKTAASKTAGKRSARQEMPRVNIKEYTRMSEAEKTEHAKKLAAYRASLEAEE